MSASTYTPDLEHPDTIYQFKQMAMTGEEVDLGQYKDHVVLIAIISAADPMYAKKLRDLEMLHRTFKDKGVDIIGIPSDEFRKDKRDGKELLDYLHLKYGVSFPIMRKAKVNGSHADPLFRFLRGRCKGLFTDSIKWSFTTFLVNRKGEPVKRFSPGTSTNKLESEIGHQVRIPPA
eukprot:gnl/Dysnectes_brevis/6171_a9351_513.p1 GENE.gnl/Dysnectes_brevis/6171_a9351_513~~gnl/Dysnectes_brevis/6171_a9351_513.p1  ORF type:complete len:176 (+),score=55.09 gnl/Dysnectes_brevis/6171_a9351_513:929-1456(+)